MFLERVGQELGQNVVLGGGRGRLMSFRIDQPRHIAEDVQMAGRIDKDNIKRAVKELKQSKSGQTPQVIRTQQRPDIYLPP